MYTGPMCPEMFLASHGLDFVLVTDHVRIYNYAAGHIEVSGICTLVIHPGPFVFTAYLGIDVDTCDSVNNPCRIKLTEFIVSLEFASGRVDFLRACGIHKSVVEDLIF
jgi:hypothetical protein